MNYYPTNFYSSYPYNQYQYPAIPSIPQMPQIQPQTQSIQTGLQGKIVDGEDIVKATDVPVGGYGIFPKADFSEIYIKTWNNNGTTSILTFKPIVKEEKPKEEEKTSNLLLDKMMTLEEKLDAVLAPKTEATAPKPTNNVTILKRKEF